MKKIEAKIIADSINDKGNRVTTFILTFPRFILAELNTHRMFSKNSASSRAIPFEKMLKMVEEDPFIPIAWQKDHKGMQGTEYFTNERISNYSANLDGNEAVYQLNEEWLGARNCAVEQAKNMNQLGLTKQLVNRLLEPFMWHTVLLTATEFDNFFKLRCPSYGGFAKNGENTAFRSKKDVKKHFEAIGLKSDVVDSQNFYSWQSINTSGTEIHMQALAESMWDAYNENEPTLLKDNEWHIPFGDQMNDQEIYDKFLAPNNFDYNLGRINQIKVQISTARCARLSYMTFDGKIDYDKDMELHNTLANSGHLSPFEHCCKAMSELEYYSYIKGKYPTGVEKTGNIFNYERYAKFVEDDEDWVGFIGENPNNKDLYGWCDNFRGFISYRHLLNG